jgi:hypothetical protein
MTLRGRIAQFVFFVGMVLLVVFFVSDQLKRPEYPYLCTAFVLLLLGLVGMLRGRKPGAKSSRFGVLHKSKQKEKEK